MIKPGLHTTLFGRRFPRFVFLGALGFIVGMLTGIVLCYPLHLQAWVVLVMSATGAACFFMLAFLAKAITGHETIVYYHHEITIVLMCVLVLHLLRLPVLHYLDLAIIGIGIFLAFGRIGCYSVGCCHGRPTRRGVCYGQTHVDAGFTAYYRNVPLLPVPLIESVFVLVAVCTSIVLLLRGTAPGAVLLCYTILYGTMRYTLEFFRGDPERPYWLGLSEAQWTTLILLAVTLGLGLAGVLPVYAAHVVVFALMVATSLFIALYYRHRPRFRLSRARSISQLAGALDALKVRSRKTNDLPDVYTTGDALCISLGSHVQEGESILHYTISLKGEELTPAEARRVARQISAIEHLSPVFEIRSRPDGVYHILYTNGHEHTKNEKPAGRHKTALSL